MCLSVSTSLRSYACRAFIRSSGRGGMKDLDRGGLYDIYAVTILDMPPTPSTVLLLAALAV
jgi:hypothetical protein